LPESGLQPKPSFCRSQQNDPGRKEAKREADRSRERQVERHLGSFTNQWKSRWYTTMYNLFVCGSEDAWDGQPVTFSTNRCLKSQEYTSCELAKQYGALTPDQIDDLKQLPSIFACETGCKKDARLGHIVAVRKRPNEIRIEYDFVPSYPPVPNETLLNLKWDLGIDDSELYRTHWALKNEDISSAFTKAGFPQISLIDRPLINIRAHVFDVALSFPGETRDYIERVAEQLVSSLGPNRVFYDKFYQAQLAVPNLDTVLQKLYGESCRLVVAFLSKDYATKKWCGIEWKAIREILHKKEDESVMYVKFDSADIPGVFSYDGYIDASNHSEIEVASMINQRIQLLNLP
jgi:hypothetical protein